MCSKRRSEIEDLDADCKISRQDDARIIETQELPGLAARILAIEKLLSGRLNSLDYGEKVEYLYNPILYAEDLHTKFLSKFLVGPTEVFFLGMNPGPFGMCQTGIPFGEVGIVRNWMQIDGLVGKPAREHPKRLVLGMSSNRSEPSGKRFWSFFEHLCKSPENFFSKAFVYNYCPAAFLDSKGANVTPVDLKASVRKKLEEICDEALLEVLKELGSKRIIGIGRYAQKKAEHIVGQLGGDSSSVDWIMHPSPANPSANGGKWEISVMESFERMDLINFFRN